MSLAPSPTSGPGPSADRAPPLLEQAGGERPGRVRRFLHDYRYPLGIFVASRLLTLFTVGAVGWVYRPKGHWHWADVYLTPLSAWDGVWYLKIAQHGYDPLLAHGNSPAFMPLYPFTVRTVGTLLPFLDLRLVGVLTSTALFAGVLILLWRLTLERYGEAVARRAVTYLGIFPLAFVFSAVYTESLFVLLTLASFLMLERGRLWSAAGFGSLAVLARPVGILLAPAIAWRVWSDEGRPWRLWGRDGQRVSGRLALRLLPVALLPLVQVGFQVYLYLVTGQVFATESAEQRGWGRQWDLLLVVKLPVAFLQALWDALLGNHNLDVALCGVVASVWAWLIIEGAWRRRIPGEYAIFAGGCLVLGALAGTYLGVPRYFVGAFPLFWLLAQHGRREAVDLTLRSAMPALMAALAFVAYGVGTYTP